MTRFSKRQSGIDPICQNVKKPPIQSPEKWMLAETSVNGLTITVPEFLTACGILIAAALGVFKIIIGAVSKLNEQIASVNQKIAILEIKNTSVEGDQNTVATKLELILKELNTLTTIVATLGERTRER